METFGVDTLFDRAPNEASLGEQQRAAVARALTTTPAFLVADEPTSHQDRANAERVIEALAGAAERGSCVLVATHDQRVFALSAWAPVVLAGLLRFVIGWVVLALAYPLARRHEIGLDPRSGWNRHSATMSDRYKVAKAFRSVRRTHHVRQVALDRISPTMSWWRRLDPIIDVVNVVGIVAFVVANMTIATINITDLAS